MTRYVDAQLVPVAVALGDRLGLTLWAPSWRDGDGEEVQSFLGSARQVVAFASAGELAEYVAGHPGDDLAVHPAWQAMLRRRPDELKAAPGDLVDFDEVFSLLAYDPAPESCEAVSKAVQLAEAIAYCCDDDELSEVLGRDAYQAVLVGPAGRGNLTALWDELGSEASASWEWVLERLSGHIEFVGGAQRGDVDAVRQRGTAASPWLAAQAPPAPGAATGWQVANYGVVDETLLPSAAPTVVITLFFGLFGLIPAAVATSHARAAGVSTNRYWAAFGWTLLMSFIAWVVLVVLVFGVVAGSG